MRIESLLKPSLPQTPSQTPPQAEEELAQSAFMVDSAQRWGSLDLNELWKFRELLYFLIWRNVKVRYKQTALGVIWVVLQPLLMSFLFSIVFGELGKVSSNGVPYLIFAFAGLLPWQLFAHALSTSSQSLVTDQQLVTKVYFPRLIVPLAAVLAGIVDFTITLGVLFGLLIFYGVPISAAMLTLPLWVLLLLGAAMGVGVWLSALNAQYRDVQYAMPFLTQFLLFATPIAYASDLVPARWQLLYALNPMVGVVDGFRWALLGQEPSLGISPLISAVVVAILLISGIVYFSRVEQSLADVI